MGHGTHDPVLGRSPAFHLTSATYRCGQFEVDPDNRSLTRDGVGIQVEPRVFAVLLQLLQRPHELITRNELLDSVWGHRYVTPSTLNRVITLLRRALEDNAEVPRFVETVHGAGYRFIGPCELVPPKSQPAAGLFAPPAYARPPARVTTLIGRDPLLAQLAELLRQNRALTILGPGGMGKTQCALELARRLRDEYVGGIWFFDLAHVAGADQWLRSLATALTLQPDRDTDPMADICGQLDGRGALLLLDNCDRIAADIGAAASRLLRGTAQLQLLATSQAPLNFVGECIVRMPPLSVPADGAPKSPPALADIAAASAVQLLIERVRATRLDFALTESNAATLASICRRLDGMPLAIELAAPRFAMLSPTEVMDGLDHRFSFLVSRAAGREARHTNLTALLDWSFALLGPEEQRLLTWLSVFVHGCTMESAIDLASCLGMAAQNAVEFIGSLTDKSLVSVDVSTSPPRNRLLESVREFALERLGRSGQGSAARNAHLECMRRLAMRAHADMLGGRMRQRIEQLVHEEGNIDAAIEHGIGTRDGLAPVQEMLGALAVYHKARTHLAVGNQRCERVLRAAAALGVPPSSRLLLFREIAHTYLLYTDEAPYLDAVQACDADSDVWGSALASAFYAQWLANMGRVDEAAARARTAQSAAGRMGDAWLQSIAGVALAFTHLHRQQNADAVALLDTLQHASDDLHQRHFVHAYLGLGHFRLANDARAAWHWLQCLQLANQVRSVRGAAGSIEGCAYIATRQADYPVAARCLGMAQHLRARTDMPLFPYWVDHHAQVVSALNTALGTRQAAALVDAAASTPEADFILDVAQTLERYAGANMSAGS